MHVQTFPGIICTDENGIEVFELMNALYLGTKKMEKENDGSDVFDDSVSSITSKNHRSTSNSMVTFSLSLPTISPIPHSLEAHKTQCKPL